PPEPDEGRGSTWSCAKVVAVSSRASMTGAGSGRGPLGGADSPPRRIPIAGPWITDLEAEYVADALATNWYEHANDYIGRFEDAFARHARRRFAISLPSCTAGIHLCLAALSIGSGDEVIVPDLTWIASAAPISYVGARPTFADVDRETWCLSGDTVGAVVTG